jgi:hypothetical protein
MQVVYWTYKVSAFPSNQTISNPARLISSLYKKSERFTKVIAICHIQRASDLTFLYDL